MPEVEFTIDRETGELRLHVKGIAGPACDDIAKYAQALLGPPGQEVETADYRLRPTIRSQIRPQSRSKP